MRYWMYTGSAWIEITATQFHEWDAMASRMTLLERFLQIPMTVAQQWAFQRPGLVTQ